MKQKEFIKKALIQIGEMLSTSNALYKLGVDICEVNMGVDLIVESIKLLINPDSDLDEDVYWWLFSDSKIFIDDTDDKKYNLEQVEDFIDFIYVRYSKEA